MSGFFNDHKFPFWTGGVNNDTSINILDKVGSIITQNSITFTELDDCRHEYLRIWMSGFFNDQKFPFWTGGVNNDTSINILDKVKSIITQSSKTFTELEDCRHEYLRLWMSGCFNDHRFTILNKCSQQWSLYQHSRQSEVNNNSKFYNIYWVRGLQARLSTIMNEWFLQWPKFTILNKGSQQWYHYQHSRQSGVNNNPKFYKFTELEDCRHEYLRLWMSGVFNDNKFTILNKWSQQ